MPAPQPSDQTPPSVSALVVRCVLLALFVTVLVRTAWIGDDAYITFRTVENAWQGFGLRFNVADRVQTSTHPLWMLLVWAVRGVTGEIYFTVLALAGTLSIATFAVLATVADRGRSLLVTGILGVLISSRAFIDYSTSGLENPLTHLLMVTFVAVSLRKPGPDGPPIRTLGIVLGLMMFNRLDTMFLCGPAYAVAVIGSLGRRPWFHLLRDSALGFFPLAAWFAFAAFYYGNPLPVTAIAKAFGMGIPHDELRQQGLHYARWLVTHDAMTAVAIVGALAATVVVILRGTPTPRGDHLVRGTPRLAAAAFAVGACFYTGYIIRIGGDFMGGRYFAAPCLLLLSVAAFTVRIPTPPATALWHGGCALGTLAVGFGLGMLNVEGRSPTLLSGSDYGDIERVDDHGIGDERSFYYPGFGLISKTRGIPQYGIAAEVLGGTADDPAYLMSVFAGVPPFNGGPHTHLIDNILTDPMLARLPVQDPKAWKIGHVERRLPEGFLETLIDDDIAIQHPGLAAYYRTLRSVIRDDLFSRERLAALWRLWTGADDQGLRDFVATDYYDPPRVTVEATAITEPLPPKAAWYSRFDIGGQRRGPIPIYDGGLEVRFAERQHATKLEASLDPTDYYFIRFERRGTAEPIDLGMVQAETPPGQYLQTLVVEVPEGIAAAGYDQVWIRKLAPFDRISSIGHLRVLPD